MKTDATAVLVTGVDVTEAASVSAAAKQISDRQRGRGLQATVNNAEGIVQGPPELVPESELHRQFDVNLHGPVRVMRAFLPLLRLGSGRIVNVTAATARIAVLPFAAPVSASKVALARLSNAARLELRQWGAVLARLPQGVRDRLLARTLGLSTSVAAR